jgi:hypothetical protein
VPPGTAVSAVWGAITGTLSNQTDLQTALNGKAALVHTHVIADVTGLQAALDGKQAAGAYAPLVHTHVIADVTNLQTTLDAKVPKTVAGTNTVQATGAAAQVVIEQTQGTYGATRLTIQSIGGLHGALFQSDTLPLIDFGFSAQGGQSNIRYELRGSQLLAGNTFEFQFGASGAAQFRVGDAYNVSVIPLAVPDEAYGASWASKLDVPTKKALYAKIEAVTAGGGGVTTFNTRSGAVVLTTADVTAAMPAFTGDVTNAAGAVASTITAKAVTLAKMADMATASVFYRKTSGAGVPEVQTLATLKTDLGLTGTNSGDQTTITGNAGTATALQNSRNFSITGAGITAAAVGFNGTADVVLAASVDAGHITLARMANVNSGTIFYRKTASAGAPEVQTLATLKTDLGIATDIAAAVSDTAYAASWDAVTTIAPSKNAVYDKIQAVIATIPAATTSIVGITGTIAQFNTACTDADFATTALFTSGAAGLAPASGGGTANFLRADGTWQPPPAGGGGLTDGDKGDVLVASSGASLTVQSAAGAFDVAGAITLINGLLCPTTALDITSLNSTKFKTGGVTRGEFWAGGLDVTGAIESAGSITINNGAPLYLFTGTGGGAGDFFSVDPNGLIAGGTVGGPVIMAWNGATGAKRLGISSTSLDYYDPAGTLISRFDTGGLALTGTGLISTTGSISLNANLIIYGSAGFPGTGNNGLLLHDNAQGLCIYGRGTTYDLTLANRDAAPVMRVPTGTNNAEFPGNVSAAGLTTTANTILGDGDGDSHAMHGTFTVRNASNTGQAITINTDPGSGEGKITSGAGSFGIDFIGTYSGSRFRFWPAGGGGIVAVIDGTGILVTGNVTVTDAAYGAGWNGSTQVPTKNAVYDEIERRVPVKISVGTVAPGSPAVNDLWVDTN